MVTDAAHHFIILAPFFVRALGAASTLFLMPHSSDTSRPAMPVTLKTLQMPLVLVVLSLPYFHANMTSAVMKLSTFPDLLDRLTLCQFLGMLYLALKHSVGCGHVHSHFHLTLLLANKQVAVASLLHALGMSACITYTQFFAISGRGDRYLVCAWYPCTSTLMSDRSRLQRTQHSWIAHVAMKPKSAQIQVDTAMRGTERLSFDFTPTVLTTS